MSARETWADYETQLEEQAMADTVEVRGRIESIERWPDGNFKGYMVNGILLQLSKAKQQEPRWMTFQVGDAVRATYASIQKGQYTNHYAQSMVAMDSVQPRTHVDGPANPGQVVQQKMPPADKSEDISVLAITKGLISPGMTPEQVTAVLNTARASWIAYKRGAERKPVTPPPSPEPAFDDGFDDDVPF